MGLNRLDPRNELSSFMLAGSLYLRVLPKATYRDAVPLPLHVFTAPFRIRKRHASKCQHHIFLIFFNLFDAHKDLHILWEDGGCGYLACIHSQVNPRSLWRIHSQVNVHCDAWQGWPTLLQNWWRKIDAKMAGKYGGVEPPPPPFLLGLATDNPVLISLRSLG